MPGDRGGQGRSVGKKETYATFCNTLNNKITFKKLKVRNQVEDENVEVSVHARTQTS